MFLEVLRLARKRKKVGFELLVNLIAQKFIYITDLHSTRELAINTAFRPTEYFPSNLGIEQGGILSTILWNIFYDPLLDRIEKETEGIRMGHHFKMSAPAFADDLHPIADSKRDIQHQLDLITEFLLDHPPPGPTDNRREKTDHNE